MKKAVTHTTPNAVSVQPSFSLGSLGVQFLDTTWRIATPVLIFAMLGIMFDRHFSTKPWATLIGTIIGFAIAIRLVKMQLARLNDGGDQ